MLLRNHSLADGLTLPSIDTSQRPLVGHWPGVCGLALVIADCIAMLVAIYIALSLLPFVAGASRTPLVQNDGFAMLYVAIVAYLALKGRYTERIPFWNEMQLVVCTSLTASACALALGAINYDLTSGRPVLIALLIFPVLGTAANLLVKYLLIRARVWIIPVVVVGNRESIAEAECALQSDRFLGYGIVGRLDPATVMSGTSAPRLRPALELHGANYLLIATDGTGALHRQLIERALQERVRFALMVQPYLAPTFASKPTCFFSHDAVLLSFQNGLSRPIPRIAKSTMDILFALMLLIVTAPVFLAICIANLLDGGPILFKQYRVGIGGRPFCCLKFRTMVVNADGALAAALAQTPELAAEWEARRKLVNDPRVTRVGRFLRKTSLDELPQLINVLRRDMSLVGPRPIVESEVSLYGDNIAQYYATRPGLTGLWQVSGRSNTSYARRVQLDVWYVNNWTLWHDIAVLLKTIPAVFGRQGAF
jgi:Undecaprenyl-phosphate galactose phosphotransferase WbaP